MAFSVLQPDVRLPGTDRNLDPFSTLNYVDATRSNSDSPSKYRSFIFLCLDVENNNKCIHNISIIGVFFLIIVTAITVNEIDPCILYQYTFLRRQSIRGMHIF